MKIQCQACQAEFNVDAAKIPEAGIKAACKQCGEPMFITRQGGAARETPLSRPHQSRRKASRLVS